LTQQVERRHGDRRAPVAKLFGVSCITGKWKLQAERGSWSIFCACFKLKGLSWPLPQHGQMRGRRVLARSKFVMMSSMITADRAALSLAFLW